MLTTRSEIICHCHVLNYFFRKALNYVFKEKDVRCHGPHLAAWRRITIGATSTALCQRFASNYQLFSEECSCHKRQGSRVGVHVLLYPENGKPPREANDNGGHKK